MTVIINGIRTPLFLDIAQQRVTVVVDPNDLALQRAMVPKEEAGPPNEAADNQPAGAHTVVSDNCLFFVIDSARPPCAAALAIACASALFFSSCVTAFVIPILPSLAMPHQAGGGYYSRDAAGNAAFRLLRCCTVYKLSHSAPSSSAANCT